MLPQQVDTDLFVSRCAMSRAFNAVMRVISSLIGVLMVLMGGIWILQGLNLAWGLLVAASWKAINIGCSTAQSY